MTAPASAAPRRPARPPQHFAWDQSGKLPLLLTDGSTSYIYGDNGLPIEQIDGSGTPLYYQQDQLGSTRLLTDQGGGVVATFTYDPYGNLASHTGSADTPLRWAGQYQDSSTGFYYLRARYYDPQTAQFITRDPLARFTQAPYGYAGSNPLNLSDLTGRLRLESVLLCRRGDRLGLRPPDRGDRHYRRHRVAHRDPRGRCPGGDGGRLRPGRDR